MGSSEVLLYAVYLEGFQYFHLGYAATLTLIFLAFAYNPWRLMQNPNTLFTALNNIGAFLGPATGILLADYLIVRKRLIDVDDLYRTEGRYRGFHGFNIPTIAVLVVTTLLCLTGEVFPSVGWLYSYAWFVGLASSFVLYLVVVWAIRTLSSRPVVEFEAAGTTGVEAAELARAPQAMGATS